MTTPLPASSKLDIGAFSRLFQKTTTSYKHLFFIGLLNCFENRLKTDNQSNAFSLREIIQELLAFGWYPHRFFKLSFGPSDQVGQILDSLKFDLSESAVTNPRSSVRLRNAIGQQFDLIKANELQRYVPFRLLSPFYQSELAGLVDHKRNERIQALAHDGFSSDRPPLYRLTAQGDAIELHGAWVDYLRSNLAIIRGWALNGWTVYLQKCNPNTPAIINKISPPQKRVPLKFQRMVWKALLTEQRFTCIYSNSPVSPSNFDLDHFIPWSFVCHDQLWNLIPATPNHNSSKGNSLPNSDQISAFIFTQQKALAVAQSILKKDTWQKVTDDYSAGLNIHADLLQDQHGLRDAFERTLTPLISLASQLGF